MRINKTGREYGRLWKAIRRQLKMACALTCWEFTYRDITALGGVTRNQIKWALMRLAEKGELRVVRKGLNNRPTVYVATNTLRPPEQTGKHL